jgi:hypothetical protein
MIRGVTRVPIRPLEAEKKNKQNCERPFYNNSNVTTRVNNVTFSIGTCAIVCFLDRPTTTNNSAQRALQTIILQHVARVLNKLCYVYLR